MRFLGILTIGSVALTLAMTAVSTAHADDGGSEDDSPYYGGIIPGERDSLGPDSSSDTTGPNALTWVGFQPEGERTRVFIQTARPARYDLRHAFGDDQIVITVRDVQILRSNFRRFIDTSHFRRNIRQIDVREIAGGDIEVILTVDDNTEPTLSEEGKYLFIDFPHEGGELRSASHRESEETEHRSDEFALAEEEYPPVVDDPTPESEEEDPYADEDIPALDEEHRHREDSPDDEGEELTHLDTDELDDASTDRRTWGLPVALGGLVLAGGGFGLHRYAESRRAVVTDVPEDEVVPVTQREAAAIERNANRLDTAALSLAIAGGVATAIGLAAWLIPVSADRNAQVTIVPTDSGVSLGFSLRY